MADYRLNESEDRQIHEMLIETAKQRLEQRELSPQEIIDGVSPREWHIIRGDDATVTLCGLPCNELDSREPQAHCERCRILYGPGWENLPHD